MNGRSFLGYVLATTSCILVIGNEARAIVTPDVFGGNVLGSGALFGGEPLGDSVALITVTNGADSYTGSGTLIGNGSQILTAGHLLNNGNGFIATSATVTFYTASGVFSNTTSDLTAHPAYDINPTNRIGYDLGLLEFPTPFSTLIPRQDILRDNSGIELTPPTGTQSQAVQTLRIGYGVTGIGIDGYNLDAPAPGSGAGTRRYGFNLYDAPTNFAVDHDRIMLYDFDGGTINVNGTDIDTNVFGNLYFPDNGETSAAPGDSGGPIYISTNNQSLIAGVTSFGLNGVSTKRPDDTTVNHDVNYAGIASFGDVGGDIRVSDPLNQNFIDLLVNHDRLLGDTNNDGNLDSLDIDFLFDAVGGLANPWLDLNLDNVIDSLDVDALVEEIFQTSYGDSDLDGDVDGSDLAILSTNWDPVGTGGHGWQNGNFDGDGDVDGSDLAILSTNWNPVGRDTSNIGGSMSLVLTNVPEPNSASLLMLALAGLSCRRR